MDNSHSNWCSQCNRLSGGEPLRWAAHAVAPWYFLVPLQVHSPLLPAAAPHRPGGPAVPPVCSLRVLLCSHCGCPCMFTTGAPVCSLRVLLYVHCGYCGCPCVLTAGAPVCSLRARAVATTLAGSRRSRNLEPRFCRAPYTECRRQVGTRARSVQLPALSPAAVTVADCSMGGRAARALSCAHRPVPSRGCRTGQYCVRLTGSPLGTSGGMFRAALRRTVGGVALNTARADS